MISPRVLVIVTCTFLVPLISKADVAVLTAAPGKNIFLGVNERMVSPGGSVVLVMQGDGNLVIYKGDCVGDPKCAVWNTQTSQQPGNYFLGLQEDGNVVIYRGTPANNQGSIWNSGSNGPIGNYFFALQDDENFVVYRGTGPTDNQGAVWSRGTGRLNVAPTSTSERVQLGWTTAPIPCSTTEWRQVYNAATKTAEQRLYAYAYVDQAALNQARKDTEECLIQAVGACGLATLTTSPAGCLPAFNGKLATCLSGRGVPQTVVNSVRLSAEAQCMY